MYSDYKYENRVQTIQYCIFGSTEKQGKSEIGAGLALLLTCGDGEYAAEVYGCATDKEQASIIFDVAVAMVDQCPALKKRMKLVLYEKE